MEVPIAYFFAKITKSYFSLLSGLLEDLDINRYYYPLYVVYKNDQCISQNELSDIIDVDKVTVVRILDYLSEKKCVVRVVDEYDRRVHRIKVTPKGVEYAKKIKVALETTNQHFLDSIDESQKHDFFNATQKMYENNKHLVDSNVEFSIKMKE